VGHDSFVCGYDIYTQDMTHLCVCGTRLIGMWDMTHLYAGHDASVGGTSLFRMWDMIYLYVGHEAFIYEYGDVFESYMTRSSLIRRHDSFVYQ